MAKSPTPLDPGLSAALAAATSNASSGSSSQPMSILQQALLSVTGYGPSSGYDSPGSLTRTPLSGIMPAWIRANPTLLTAVQQNQLNPYIPDPARPETLRVYMGPGAAPLPKATKSTNANVAENNSIHRYDKVGDQTKSAGVAMNEPYLWSAEEVQANIKRFREAGRTDITDFDSLTKAWQGLVARAAQSYSFSSGKIKMTPWDALDLDRDARIASGSMSANGSRTTSQTAKSVSEISQGDAWTALRQTVSNMLGRDPGDQEVRDFAYRMNSLAAKNPTISHSTQTIDAAGNSNVSTHTKQGFGANDVAEGAYKDAQSDPDYAEYQSATTYYNAALSALGAIGGN